MPGNSSCTAAGYPARALKFRLHSSFSALTLLGDHGANRILSFCWGRPRLGVVSTPTIQRRSHTYYLLIFAPINVTSRKLIFVLPSVALVASLRPHPLPSPPLSANSGLFTCKCRLFLQGLCQTEFVIAMPDLQIGVLSGHCILRSLHRGVCHIYTRTGFLFRDLTDILTARASDFRDYFGNMQRQPMPSEQNS